ncbi:MAG: hypothetical protein QOF48_3049 [Verrucomicrobiota bacterium]|jgi:hypothetical protein
MSQNTSEGVRRPVFYAVALLIAVVVGAVVFQKMKRPRVEPPEQTSTEPAPTTGYTRPKPIRTAGETPAVEPAPAPAPPPPPVTVAVPARTNASPVAVLPGPRVEPSAETRSLVSSIANIDLATTVLTPEAAAAWKQNLAQLAQNGAASVPAIQEFLALNKDVNFDAVPGAKGLLGSASLRLSLLDALGNINAPEAQALSAQMLQSTTDPREIALLAQNLDRQVPEQYRESAVAAARVAMAEAAAGRLAGKDVGPLFDLLRNYGGATAVEDFQQAAAGPWKYYATIALADLPDGAGVPALVQMISDPKNPAIGGRVAALQALAQLTPDNAEARNALMEQARQGNIPGATWINIAASLAGERFQIGTAPAETNPNMRSWHLSYGNQNYFATTGPLTAEQIQQRLGLVDQFMALNNNNSIASTALQDARNKLANRFNAAGPK